MGLLDCYDSFISALDRHLPVRRFFVKPLESVGIPSFAVAVLILLVIVAGAAWLLSSSPQAGGAGTLRIVVASDGEAVAGATVELSSDAVMIASGATVNGKIEFAAEMGKTYSLRVSKPGFADVVRKITAGKTAVRVTLEAQAAVMTILEVAVLDKMTQTPLAGALVEGTGFSVRTDSSGIAKVNASVSALKISMAGYRFKAIGLSSSLGRMTVLLDKETIDPASGFVSMEPEISFASKGLLAIRLSSGDKAIDGEFRIYDVADKLLYEGSTLNGIGSASIDKGTTVYLTASATGYLPYDGSSATAIIEDYTEIEANLTAAESAGGAMTRIRAINGTGELVDGAGITLLSLKGAVLSKYDGNDWQLSAGKGEYYAIAFADGYLYASKKFSSTDAAVDLVIEKATPFNSALLKVIVRNEYGEKLPYAYVSVYLDGLPASDRLSVTEEEGSVELRLKIDKDYIVRAQYLSYSAEKSVRLGLDGAEQSIMLETNTVSLNASAFDAVTLLPVNAAYSLRMDGAEISRAQGNNVTLKAKAGKSLELLVKTDGYLEYNASEVFMPGADAVRAYPMTPINSATEPLVTKPILLNSKLNIVTDVVAGTDYILRVETTPAAYSDNQTLYVRVGDADSVDADIAGIFYVPTADFTLQSNRYAKDDSCSELSPEGVTPKDGLFKWVAITFKGSQQKTTDLQLRIKPNAAGTLNIYYAMSSSKGGTIKTSPAGPAAKCHPLPYQYSLAIKRPTNAPVATPVPATTTLALDIPSDITDKLELSFNPATGNVEGIDSIRTQTDSIFPADAIPITLNENTCIIGLQILMPKGDSRNCYFIENNKLVIRAEGFNGNCLIDKPVQATLRAIPACRPDKVTDIPITNNHVIIPDVSFAPQTLDEGDNTAKLIYLTNSRQAGDLQIKLIGAAGSIGVNPGDSEAVAWSGPGTLTLMEGDKSLAEWTYNQANSYFEGKGSVGPRVDSCSGETCCAAGWCTGGAFLSAFNTFKKNSMDLASKTAFRRGNGEPAKSLGYSFSRSMVAQLVAKVSSALSVLGITVESVPEGCDSQNPGVYKIVMSSTDGAAWKYNGGIMSLKYNLNADGNRPALCNFLYASGSNIVQASTANLACISQTSEDKSAPKTIVAHYAAALLFKQMCAASKLTTPKTGVPTCGFLSTIPIPELTMGGGDVGLAGISIGYCMSGNDAVAKYSQLCAMEKQQQAAGLKMLKLTLSKFCASGASAFESTISKASTCTALCEPRPACVEIFPSGNQLTTIVHLGLQVDCMPFSQNALQELAASFAIANVFKNAGPYAMLAQMATGMGGCSGMTFGFNGRFSGAI